MVTNPTTGTSFPVLVPCLDRSGPVLALHDDQVEQFKPNRNLLPDNLIVDASTATWNGVGDYPVVLDGGENICFSGGSVSGNYPDSTSWETMHGTAGLVFRTTGNTSVENVRIHNYGDGITFSRGDPGDSFQVIGVYMTHIRDDCVENDYMYSGFIDGSLFDGCYTAFSARSYSSSGDNQGGENLWTIQNSLIRLEPMEKVYNDRGLIPGHGPFFKWDKDENKSPRLSLHNNIFRADQPSNSRNGLGLPEGKLASCSDNIVVWLGEGDYPDTLPEYFLGQRCFTITTDRSVWDDAVRNWIDQH